jgi:hypothetical protein
MTYARKKVAWSPVLPAGRAMDIAERLAFMALEDGDRFPHAKVYPTDYARKHADKDGWPVMFFSHDDIMVAAGLAEKRRESEWSYALEVALRYPHPVQIVITRVEVHFDTAHGSKRLDGTRFTLNETGHVYRVMYG